MLGSWQKTGSWKSGRFCLKKKELQEFRSCRIAEVRYLQRTGAQNSQFRNLAGLQYSTTPVLHYSNAPVLRCSAHPLFAFVPCFLAITSKIAS
jgi:hypothetical protein